MPISAIDMVQSVFSLGLFGVVHGQGETMLEDAEECDDDWNHFRFHQGILGGQTGVMDKTPSLIAPKNDLD